MYFFKSYVVRLLENCENKYKNGKPSLASIISFFKAYWCTVVAKHVQEKTEIKKSEIEKIKKINTLIQKLIRTRNQFIFEELQALMLQTKTEIDVYLESVSNLAEDFSIDDSIRYTKRKGAIAVQIETL